MTDLGDVEIVSEPSDSFYAFLDTTFLDLSYRVASENLNMILLQLY